MPRVTEHCGCCGVHPDSPAGLQNFLFFHLLEELLPDASQLGPALNKRKTLCPRLCSLPGDRAHLMNSSCGRQRLVDFASIWDITEGPSQLQNSPWESAETSAATSLQFKLSSLPSLSSLTTHRGYVCQGSPVTSAQKPQCLSLFPGKPNQ